jgi:acyl carrier protein
MLAAGAAAALGAAVLGCMVVATTAVFFANVWPLEGSVGRGHLMLRTDDITARVSNVLVARLGISPDKVAEVASIEADLGATSVDMVETIMSLEDEFGIEISDRDAETLQTVGDVIALVKKKFWLTRWFRAADV